jgi:hypothetical protein
MDAVVEQNDKRQDCQRNNKIMNEKRSGSNPLAVDISGVAVLVFLKYVPAYYLAGGLTPINPHQAQ